MPPSFLSFAHSLADASGVLLRRYFRAPVDTEMKSDLTPVTQVDREVEAELRRRITEAFPLHGFAGEESGAVRTNAEYLWVIDPIDGTKNFLTGKPVFVTLIALLHHGNPMLGVIDNPVTRERWVGSEGRTTLWSLRAHCGNSPGMQEMPQQVQHDGGSLKECTLSTTSPYLFAGKKRAAFERLREAVKYTTFGNDGYAYALLASGHLGLVAESGLKAHDVMALIPVVEGAGGILTDWRGQPIPFTSGEGEVDVIASASRSLHAAALELLC